MIEVEGEAFRLDAGDLIAFSARKPHRLWNEGVSVARSVWIGLDRK